MKIDPLTGVRAAAPRRSASSKSSGGSSFAEVLAHESDGQSAVGAQTPLGVVDSLLALQEIPDGASHRREARERGDRLLDQLDEIRVGLLTGRLTRAVVEQLAALVKRHIGKVDDPRLAEILGEIELRAAVELAKLERLQGPAGT